MNNICPESGANTAGILCLARYEKGQRFLVEAKNLGCRGYLLTSNIFKDSDWPRESRDDFDLEKAALVREHLRIEGMGESAARYCRDKLAMRTRPRAGGGRVPTFTSKTNYIDINSFVDSVATPWVLKLRLLAGAIGIQKVKLGKRFGRGYTVWATGNLSMY